MSKWPMVRFGDHLESSRVVVDLKPDSIYSATGVKSFGRGLIHYPADLPDNLSKMRYHELPASSLIISNIKAWEGAVASTPAAVANDAVISNRFHCYRPKTSHLDIDFTRRYLLSESGISQLSAASPGSADRNRTLSIDGLEDLRIPMPPLDEQRRIAERLHSVDRLQGEIQGLQVRAARLRGAIVDSLLDVAADGAVLVALGEVMVQRSPDVVLSLDSEVVQAGVYSFGRGLFRRPPIQGADTSYRTMTKIENDDFVYSKLMAWEGAVAVASEAESGTLASPEFPVFSVDPSRLSPGYLSALIRSDRFAAVLRGAATGTNVRRRRVNASEMLNITVPLPTMSVQEDLVRRAAFLPGLGRGSRETDTRSSALLPSALNQVFGSLA